MKFNERFIIHTHINEVILKSWNFVSNFQSESEKIEDNNKGCSEGILNIFFRCVYGFNKAHCPLW